MTAAALARLLVCALRAFVRQAVREEAHAKKPPPPKHPRRKQR